MLHNYLTKEDQLMTLEGWREKSAKRFLDSLEQSKSAPFEQLLFALGIRHVGESTAKSIARHFGSLYAVASAGREELLEVEDVGDIIADSVYEWFRDGFHLEICRRLKDAGLQTEIVKKDSRQSDSLRGKSIVISGYLLPFMTCLRELSLFMLLCVQGFILSTTLDYFDEMGLYAFSSGINLILIITILVCNTLVNKVTGASLDKGIGG